jgi:hypothetical protein
MRLGCAAGTDFPVIFARRTTLWQHIDELAEALHIDVSTIPATEREPYTLAKSRESLLTPLELSHLITAYAPISGLFIALGNFLVLNQTTCASPAVRTLLKSLADETYVRWRFLPFMFSCVSFRYAKARSPCQAVSKIMAEDGARLRKSKPIRIESALLAAATIASPDISTELSAAEKTKNLQPLLTSEISLVEVAREAEQQQQPLNLGFSRRQLVTKHDLAKYNCTSLQARGMLLTHSAGGSGTSSFMAAMEKALLLSYLFINDGVRWGRVLNMWI